MRSPRMIEKNLTSQKFFNNVYAKEPGKMHGINLSTAGAALITVHDASKIGPYLKEESNMKKEKKDEKGKKELSKRNYVKPILTKHKKLREITAGLTRLEM